MTPLVRTLLPFAILASSCIVDPSPARAGETFSSGGDSFAIERFPAKAGATPRKVVVLVHGTDGLKLFGGRFRDFARELESKGFLVVLPNYFGLDDNAPKSGTPEEEVQRLADAITWAAGQADADKAHVGLVGFSLGSALSLVYAERNPGAIRALVDNYGPTDPKAPRMSGTLDPRWTIVRDCAKLPPTLILHNRQDEIVPMDQHSVPLIDALRKTPVKCDFQPYPGGDLRYGYHPFVDGSTEDRDSKKRTIDWLTTHL